MDDGAAVEDDGVVGDRQDQLRVLLDEDRRHPFAGDELLDRAQQLLHDDRCEAFHRFIQQQQCGIRHQRASDGDHLLLAA